MPKKQLRGDAIHGEFDELARLAATVLHEFLDGDGEELGIDDVSFYVEDVGGSDKPDALGSLPVYQEE